MPRRTVMFSQNIGNTWIVIKHLSNILHFLWSIFISFIRFTNQLQLSPYIKNYITQSCYIVSNYQFSDVIISNVEPITFGLVRHSYQQPCFQDGCLQC